MSYAHQNIDLKQAPGFPAPTARAPLVADAGKGGQSGNAQTTKPGLIPVSGATDRPWQLTARSASALTDIGAALRAVKPVDGKPSASLIPVRPASGPTIRVASAPKALTEVSGGGRLAFVAGAR